MSRKARQYAAETYNRLGNRQRALITACGGIESAASITRVEQAHMGRYNNRNASEQMPADVIADLEKDAQEPIVSRALVQLLGFEIVKLPQGRWEGDINQQLAAMFKEVGEVSQRIGQALADDGCVSKDEARQLHIRKEIADALQVLVGMDKAIEQIEEGD